MTEPAVDWAKLAAEVTARHRIRVDADDPLMAVVTLNRLVFEGCVTRAVEQLQSSAAAIEQAAAKMQVRVGAMLAQEMKGRLEAIERDAAAALEWAAANANANAVRRLHWFLFGFSAGAGSVVGALALRGSFG